MNDLIEFLKARIDEDERVAMEASRRDEDGYTPTGEHWQWEDDETDEPVVLDPVADEYVNGGYGVALRSREQYPTSSVGPLPHMVISGAEEVDTVVGMHIVRHDPARVLREVKAKRKLIEEIAVDANGLDMQVHGEWGVGPRNEVEDPCLGDVLLRVLGEVYREHRDWREEWAA